MALTVANANPNAGNEVVGYRRLHFVTVTFDNSYTTGGLAFDPAQFGVIGKPGMTLALPRIFGADTTKHLICRYDRVNKKLQAFQQSAATGALTEVPNACDLSTLVVDVLIVEGDGS